MSASGLEILNLHAQGGMAEVYRARATDERGRVWHYAVKRILPELIEDPEMLRMFIEEQRVAACLVHENIVRVYDVAHAEKEHFIVMEFLEGKDLHAAIEAANARKRTLPVWLAIHVAREVCKALHHATTEAKDKSGRVLGLIHRDISPHNIFLCRDGQVKLTDFGVARVETAEVRTRAGIIKGKFGYMSPEQLMAGPLDFRSDLYNVGILLYEMLTARRLFYGETATQFVAAMMLNEVPPLDKRLLVPAELDALMRRSLARKREERPASPLAFEKELAAIADRYDLAATRAHMASELQGLFPELATVEGAAVVDEQLAEKVAVEARRNREAPQPRNVKKLTLMTSSPMSQDKELSAESANVFSSFEPNAPAPRPRAPFAPPRRSSSSSSSSSSPSPPSVRRDPTPMMERALAGPTAGDTDDALVPTLIEDRPTAAQLGLEPSADERVRTEPQRLPAFGPRPSSTAPSDPVRSPGAKNRAIAEGPAVASQDNDHDIDDDDDDGGEETDYQEATTEMSAPASREQQDWASLPKTAPPETGPPRPGKHRISTGASRRVISLEGNTDNSGTLPRKKPT